jgi:hypothetical protein
VVYRILFDIRASHFSLATSFTGMCLCSILTLALVAEVCGLFIPHHSATAIGILSPKSSEQLFPETVPDLRRRDETPVDLSSIPINGCNVPPGVVEPYCTDQPPSFVDCPLIPCKDGSDIDCQSYSHDCFCNQPSPLRCAWSCDWRGWMGVEDWFSRTCPEVPPVDFSPLPSCARNCIESNSLKYGCISQSRNCFCLEGNLFNCTDSCGSKSEVQDIADWYSGLCSLSNDTSFNTVYSGNGTFQFTAAQSGHKQAIVIEPPVPNKLQWYEILVIFTAVLTFVVGCLWAFALYIFKRTWGLGKEERAAQEKRKTAEAKKRGEEKAAAEKLEQDQKIQKAKENPEGKLVGKDAGWKSRISRKQKDSKKDDAKVEDPEGENGRPNEEAKEKTEKDHGTAKGVLEEESKAIENTEGEEGEKKFVEQRGRGREKGEAIVTEEEGRVPEMTRWKQFLHRYFDFGTKGTTDGEKRSWRYYLGLSSS